MTISIEPVSDSHHDDVYLICRAAWEADVPDIPFVSRALYQAILDHPRAGHDVERYLALLDGVPAGFLQIRMPTADNRHTANLDLLTEPGSRRRGVGRALFEHAVTRARALGRTHLMSETTDHRPDGNAFATEVGAKASLADTRSRLDLPPGDQSRLDALLAEAWTHAGDYQLVQWTGVPPEEIIADVAYLDGRLIEDAPMGELAYELEQIDAARVRMTEEHLIAVGRTTVHTGATRDGRLVAWTNIAVDNDTAGQAWQQITLVDPPHRGHRLGLIIKLENLRHIRSLVPRLTAIDTTNATANDHMLAINEALGFRPVDHWMHWQLTV